MNVVILIALLACALTAPNSERQIHKYNEDRAIILHVGQPVLVGGPANRAALICPSVSDYKKQFSTGRLSPGCYNLTAAYPAVVVHWYNDFFMPKLKIDYVKVKGTTLNGFVTVDDLVPVIPPGTVLQTGCACCRIQRNIGRLIRQIPGNVNDLVIRFTDGRVRSVSHYDTQLADGTPTVVWPRKLLDGYRVTCRFDKR